MTKTRVTNRRAENYMACLRLSELIIIRKRVHYFMTNMQVGTFLEKSAGNFELLPYLGLLAADYRLLRRL